MGRWRRRRALRRRLLRRLLLLVLVSRALLLLLVELLNGLLNLGLSLLSGDLRLFGGLACLFLPTHDWRSYLVAPGILVYEIGGPVPRQPRYRRPAAGSSDFVVLMST